MSADIQIQKLSKSYGEVSALRDIDLEVEKGELFGLIGPDGAGKTTLIRILATLLLADQGEASILGLDVVGHYRDLRSRIGYMPGRFSLYTDLTVEENIRFFATIFGTTLEENYDLIKDIYSQIEPFKNRRAGDLSGGMKQKLALSCAMIHAPEIILLDEPTTGVDAVSRREFWDMLKRLRERGVTLLVSTPYMDEATLCDRVALIQDGQIMQVDTPDDVIRSFDRPLYEVSGPDKYELLKAIRTYPHTNSVFPFGETLHYTDRREEPDMAELAAYLSDIGQAGVELSETRPGIEDCFMQLMLNN